MPCADGREPFEFNSQRGGFSCSEAVETAGRLTNGASALLTGSIVRERSQTMRFLTAVLLYY
jgi:hypothetical protein